MIDAMQRSLVVCIDMMRKPVVDSVTDRGGSRADSRRWCRSGGAKSVSEADGGADGGHPRGLDDVSGEVKKRSSRGGGGGTQANWQRPFGRSVVTLGRWSTSCYGLGFGRVKGY
jgi:hypothetical protein